MLAPCKLLTHRSPLVCAAVPTTSEGVFSYSPQHSSIPASLTYNFNISLRRIKEDVRYAYARIPKQPLSKKTLERVKEQCNGPISLQLLLRVHSNQTEASSQNVFTLLSRARLQANEIGRSLQVEFSDITEQFKQWQKEESASARQGDIVEMRLIIGGTGSCYNTLTPQELGFRSNTSAYVVVFSKSDDSKEALIKAGLAELAAEATASRQRRNAGEGSIEGEGTSSEGQDGNVTRLNNHAAFNISHYHLRSCRRYSHTVSHRPHPTNCAQP